MIWRFTPYAVPLFIGALLLYFVAYISWQRRALPGAIYFMWACITINFYILGYIIELGSTNLQDTFLGLRIEYLGVPFMSVFLFLMTLDYTGHQRHLTPLALALLLVFPAMSLVMAWTNDYHELMWRGIALDTSGAFTATLFTRGTWNWIAQTGYAYLLNIAAILLFMRAYFKARGSYRRQLSVILLGITVPVVASVVYIGGLAPHGLDTTPYGFAVMAPVVALGMFQYQLFDLMPVAHETIVAGLHDAVIVIDARRRVVELNKTAQQIAGRSYAEAIGQFVDDVLPAYLHGALPCIGDDDEETEISVNDTGKRHDFDVRLYPLRRDEKIAGYLLVLRDISARKQAEQQQLDLTIERERVKILSNFIERASHEFRTPLSIIGSKVHLLKKDQKSEQQQRHLSDIQNQIDQIDGLVDALVTMSRLDSGVTWETAPLDLNYCVQTVLPHLQTLCKEKGQHFALEMADDLPPIHGNAEGLQLALCNILDNACRYTPAHGAITMRSYLEGNTVVIEVADSGMGIKPDDLPHVFERFYRADKAGSSRGFGLGLPIAQRIIERHHGNITMQSTLDMGTRLKITLPVTSKNNPETD